MDCLLQHGLDIVLLITRDSSKYVWEALLMLVDPLTACRTASVEKK